MGAHQILPGVVSAARQGTRDLPGLLTREPLQFDTSVAAWRFVATPRRPGSATPPPCRVEHRRSLVANLTQSGDRRVLHLLNWTGDAENEANYLPPVENVTVHITIPDGKKVRACRPASAPLAATTNPARSWKYGFLAWKPTRVSRSNSNEV